MNEKQDLNNNEFENSTIATRALTKSQYLIAPQQYIEVKRQRETLTTFTKYIVATLNDLLVTYYRANGVRIQQ